MNLSISSVFTAYLFGTIIILLFCPLLKRSSTIRRIGPGCVSVLLLCLAVRLLFPYELWFTYSIRVEKILPSIREALNYEIWKGSYPLTVWMLLVILWFTGMLYQMGKRIRFYRSLMRCMKVLPQQDGEEFVQTHGLDGINSSEVRGIRFVQMEQVSVPCLLGIGESYVLMPNKEYEKQELELILRHEIMHYRKKHTFWKTAMDILCAVFWWNPAFGYLKKTFFHIIEIDNDRKLTEEMSDEEQVSYMECLRNLAMPGNGQEVPFGVSFSKDSVKELKQRLYLIGEGLCRKRRDVLLNVAFIVMVIFLSFAVILEPVEMLLDGEGIALTSENTVLIKNGAVYDVYLDGEYIFNVDDLLGFDRIPILEEKPSDFKKEDLINE